MVNVKNVHVGLKVITNSAHVTSAPISTTPLENRSIILDKLP